MQYRRETNGEVVTIDPASLLGGGGEGQVYKVSSHKTLAAKIYSNPTDAHAHKLKLMLSNAPQDPMLAQGHVSIAWPVDLLRTTDSSRRIVGYLMPCLTSSRKAFEFYNPNIRRKKCPFFNYSYLHRAARNFAAAMSAIHQRGYVVGDVNESNIFVTETALVAVIDTDSFQVHDPHSHEVHRCTVHKEEFTPPELQGVDLRKTNRCIEHDLFGLAILVFQLLMEGTHPFGGGYGGSNTGSTIGSSIKAGHFLYGTQKVPNHPMQNAPRFDALHPELQRLFLLCFQDGHANPKVRPSAQAWQHAIEIAEGILVTCSANNQHRYSSHNVRCPWCDRAKKLGGFDCFPSKKQNQRKQSSQVNLQKSLPPASLLHTSAVASSRNQHTYPAMSAHGLSITSLYHVAALNYWKKVTASIVAKANRWAVATILFAFAAYWSFPSRPLSSVAAIVCGLVYWRYASSLAGKWTTGTAMAITCIMLLPTFVSAFSSRSTTSSMFPGQNNTVSSKMVRRTKADSGLEPDGVKQKMYAAVIATRTARSLNNEISTELFTLQDQQQRGVLTEENATEARAKMRPILQEALTNSEHAINLDSNSKDAWFQRVCTLYFWGKYPEADHYLRQATAKFPDCNDFDPLRPLIEKHLR